ncbi:MAG: branched-chain amino acid transport system II carrier protein [Phascolarctobacterium sp.]|uniref:branched-chain amino acid transport system II carrier protein n=1 Tax=Phascolarctobacterium sp. TaxID=2049039 RepID=UPI0026DAE664|nr:branched-chain amino acid transport system II carrier protein [Phascolarctobacterium sp.]MDO4922226.1 branched-chain amino acid transport system II carrier protein [Phascolarctobacterium sp.]
MSLAKILPIGLMLFSFFFGAGNLIFPPVLGQMSGENLTIAAIGFCLSGVGFPLLGILAMAIIRSNNPDDMARPVSTLYARTISILCALTIGPFFAIPRTAAVSFDTGILPLLPDGSGAIGLAVYSLFFFGLSYFLSVNPSKIVDNIGKIMSPLLLVCLGILIIFVITSPMGGLQPANGVYKTAPFFKGFQDGYNTMDLLCSMLYGAVIVKSIEATGIKDQKQLTNMCIYAGIIAAICLALIYGALAYAGAVSTAAFGIVSNGGQLLNMISVHYMGFPGQMVLALIIFFACITTSIGLTTSISAYFHELGGGRLQYQRLCLYISLFSLVVSNFGLNNIIKFSIPVICMLYPIVIAIVLLNVGHSVLKGDKIIFRVCLTLTTVFAIFDGLRAGGFHLQALDALLVEYLPLFDIGFGWVLPCFGGMLLGYLYRLIFTSKVKNNE